MSRNIPSDEVLQAFAKEHLSYEVNMLINTARVLSQPNNEQFVINAFLSSFTIHLRALIDFIWDPSNIKKDDAIASDFFMSKTQWEQIRPEFPLELKPTRSRTGKEIAHLTYARMDVTPDIKDWNIAEMTNAILHSLIIFTENAEKSRVGNALANLQNNTR
ncbi:hypothetical protein [Thiohalophilus sp.]|uniref:hypothetical protein n=1 Tax=Thiohalophilus sp. TaxID=3028392 RepID=UPI002ACDCC82|nr:hypothetical protein [Thiohalophilus sp.]MDZ7660929.1 hypothetical protein [Thiohalophilus sp.]